MASSNVLLEAQSGDTLLKYAFCVDPDPLRVSGKGMLTLIVSNPGRTVVTCTAIKVYITPGPQAKNLTATDATIETRPQKGWNARLVDGAFVLTPSGSAGQIGPDGASFVFAAIDINDQPGTAAIGITETASTGGQPAQDRHASIDVYKFPVAFALGTLTCDPDDIPWNGSTTLTWSGTGEHVTYTLGYRPGDGGDLVSVPVPAAGPWPVHHLTRTGGVVFTLTATMTIPGQDAPIVAKRQTTVTVSTLSLTLVVQPPAVGRNGLVRLSWRAPNAEYCTLEDGTRLPAAGTCFVTLAQSRDFLMTAYGGGDSRQEQRHVAVDPAIVATETGYAITGVAGGQGADGTVCNESVPDPRHRCYPTPGGKGGAGGDARLDGQLPPLDTTVKPRRVIPIALTGGQGGPGGSGGCTIPDFGPPRNEQPDGPGGDGGSAILAATFDKPGEPPAQYVVVPTPGQGGTGSSPGSPGGISLPGSTVPQGL